MKSPWEFKQYGQSGIPVSSLFPNVAQHVDDLCVVRSMVGEGVDHGAALLQTFTGTSTFIRPSMGSWVLYGLGTENQDLPGFITIKPALSHGGAKNWSSAFLPGAYQGTAIGNAGMKIADIQGEPIEYLLNKHYSPDQQRFELDMLQNINRRHAEVRHHDPQLEARIQAFELAFSMQAQAPEAFQVEKESDATKKLYGLDDEHTTRLRLAMPAGPPSGRARRPLHPVHPQLQVGSARRALRQAQPRTPRKSTSPSPACSPT